MSKLKIAVCTLCINDWYYEIVKYGVKTIRLYAEKHGYDFHICNDVYESCVEKRDYPWYKIKCIQKILPDYDYVFWIDADGFVMKNNIMVEDYINEYMMSLDKTYDLLIADDGNFRVNTGMMILKNSPFIFSLLNLIWINKHNFDKSFHEQASLSEIIDNNRLNCKHKIYIIPKEKRYVFFGYWAEYYPNKHFFMHIARCAHDRSGFVLTLDNFCPIKMDDDSDDESDEEYNTRIKWLNTPDLCRNDIISWYNKTSINEGSSRYKKYLKKYGLIRVY